MSKTMKRVIISIFAIIIVAGLLILDYFLDKEGAWFGNYPAGWVVSVFAILIGMLASFELLRLLKPDVEKLTRKLTLIAVIFCIMSAVFIGHKTLHNTNIINVASYITIDGWSESFQNPETFKFLPSSLITNVLRAQVLLSSVYIFGWSLFFIILIWVRNLWCFKDTDADHLLRLKSVSTSIIIYILIALPFSFGLLLRMIPYFGFAILIFTLAVSRLGDAGAYIFGKLLGKHKLIINVSPKKTIEGCLGGLVTSAAVGALVTYFFDLHIFFKFDTWLIGALIGAVIGFAAQTADLVSSAIKRKAGAKDSGRLVPELGGVLDVVDNFMFSLPVMYFIVILVWIV